MADGDNIIDFGDAKARLTELAQLDPISYGQRRKAEAKKIGVSVAVLDKEVEKRRRTPAVSGDGPDFILTDKGAIQPVFANAAAVLRHHAMLWPLAFDEFSQRQFLGGQPLTDGDLFAIAEWVQRQGVLAGKKVIDEAVIHTANLNRFHAVKDWLKALEWDGIERLDMMLVDHAGAEDTPLTRAFTSKWMIQAVARIYQPGCQADATLILEGGQDLGKSSLLRALFGDLWFTDHLPDLSNKDAQIQLLGIWCIEIAELATLERSVNAKIKQFLTSRDDRFRLPWDRLAAQHPRQSVFAGTVNPGASGYLKDETGGRRFWPVIVTEINVAAVYDRREQLWAEAVHRYEHGENWHLGNGSIADDAKEAQSARYVGDPWQEAIENFLGARTEITMEQIFIDCLGLSAKADWTQREMNRVAACLGHIQWERFRKPLDPDTRKRPWAYRRTNAVKSGEVGLFDVPVRSRSRFDDDEIG